MPQSHKRDSFHRHPGLYAAQVKRATFAGQQPAPDTQSNQLSVEEEDLKLTAAPGMRSVNVDD